MFTMSEATVYGPFLVFLPSSLIHRSARPKVVHTPAQGVKTMSVKTMSSDQPLKTFSNSSLDNVRITRTTIFLCGILTT